MTRRKRSAYTNRLNNLEQMRMESLRALRRRSLGPLFALFVLAALAFATSFEPAVLPLLAAFQGVMVFLFLVSARMAEVRGDRLSAIMDRSGVVLLVLLILVTAYMMISDAIAFDRRLL